MTDTDLAEALIALTSGIVTAHVSNNSVAVEDVPNLITTVHAALAGLGTAEEEEAPPEPAVSIRSSVKKDAIACLECGAKMKVLKRHLSVYHDMTPAEYRERWNLPADYPMVAAEYADRRRDLAKKIGLGKNPNQKRGRRKAKA